MPPVLFSRSLFPALQQLEGDRGAASILHSSAYRGRVVEARSPLFSFDVDTEEDFIAVQRRWKECNTLAGG
ncbi:MobA-like NTP transferase domain protein [compost metagenome]